MERAQQRLNEHQQEVEVEMPMVHGDASGMPEEANHIFIPQSNVTGNLERALSHSSLAPSVASSMRAAAKRKAEDDATDMKDFGDTPKKLAKPVPDKKLLNDFQIALIERRAKLGSLKVSHSRDPRLARAFHGPPR